MQSLESEYAIVKTERSPGQALVPISTNKPEVPEDILRKWQRIIDSTAKILKMPSGLITRLSRERLHIIAASATEGNPYKTNDSDSLGIGMFCESVAGTREKLVVQDTGQSDYWRTNPHAGLGMRSYCGVPICWDDGEIFGTFCMLSDRTNQFSELYQQLLSEFKEILESDLRYIQAVEDLEKKLDEKELFMREVHHRVKNHFNLVISLINLQAQEKSRDIDSILEDLQNRLHAIAFVHEQLHASNESQPELSAYIRRLSDSISHSFARKRVEIRYEVDTLRIPIETSVPIGLIISELLSNSLKYANNDQPTLAIRIRMSSQPDGTLRVFYCDNGPGYPPEMKADSAGTLGMNLVHILSAQLGGEARLYNDQGACYTSVLRIARDRQAPD